MESVEKEKVIQALQQIEVKGETNLNYLLYAIQTLRKMEVRGNDCQAEHRKDI